MQDGYACHNGLLTTRLDMQSQLDPDCLAVDTQPKLPAADCVLAGSRPDASKAPPVAIPGEGEDADSLARFRPPKCPGPTEGNEVGQLMREDDAFARDEAIARQLMREDEAIGESPVLTSACTKVGEAFVRGVRAATSSRPRRSRKQVESYTDIATSREPRQRAYKLQRGQHSCDLFPWLWSKLLSLTCLTSRCACRAAAQGKIREVFSTN